jgi:hypothetical protein
MNRNTSRVALLAVLVSSAVTVAAGQTVTPEEKQKAQDYLASTKQGLLDSTKGLSEAQLNYKATPDRWSIAEVVEHLALTEEFIDANVLANFEKAPAAPANRDFKQIDAKVLALIPDRSTKFQAPPPITPKDRWTLDQALAHFSAARAETLTFLESTPDLRQHVIQHPAAGELDGYEWVLLVAAHTERHTKQIQEVKASPGYPGK